jgi:hypothetical protein
MDARDSAGATALDYKAVAELFPPRSRKADRQSAGYRSFDRVADALRFVIEELPGKSLLGPYLEVDELRFGHREMRRLYDSAEWGIAA